MHHHRLINKSLIGLYVAGAWLLLSSCAGPKTTTTTQGTSYSEDLSVWRPKVEIPETPSNQTTTDSKLKKPIYAEAKLAVNKPLNAVLDSINQINLSKKYIDGFSIQVFAGKREEALNAKKQITLSLPEIACEIQFTEPIFRVKVGKYYTRLDAQEDYAAVRKYFPAAIIVPEKINLN